MREFIKFLKIVDALTEQGIDKPQAIKIAWEILENQKGGLK